MKKSKSILVTAIACLMAATNIASAVTFGTGANQFTIDFVTISGSTNPASGYGIVNNDYRIGTYVILMSLSFWARGKLLLMESRFIILLSMSLRLRTLLQLLQKRA